jgi:hypothetical protein
LPVTLSGRPPAAVRATPEKNARRFGDWQQREGIMNETTSGATFRGLPLTPEQDSEIRHYIHVHTRHGLPWDTPELQAMLNDMLKPPELADEDSQALHDCMGAAYAAAMDENGLDGDAPPDHEHPGRPLSY